MKDNLTLLTGPVDKQRAALVSTLQYLETRWRMTEAGEILRVRDAEIDVPAGAIRAEAAHRLTADDEPGAQAGDGSADFGRDDLYGMPLHVRCLWLAPRLRRDRGSWPDTRAAVGLDGSRAREGRRRSSRRRGRRS